jgi:glutaredoxin
LIAIGILSGLFYLLSQPPKPIDNSNSQNTNLITNGVVDEFIDPYKDSPVYDNPDLVFFWGDGCPHCENVEFWIKDNNTENNLKINFKEIYHSDSNKDELLQTIKQYCPQLLIDGGIGVPIAFDPVGQQCISGDTPIIDFLSSKLGE